MRVIGTAGHVDHGKSTLVKRITGIDPDRLAEEKAREMTIDLGFAWLTLPEGETIGIVDVPGHRDFIENMLAGVGGIDAVLLVIAADEGVMPQTQEHLAILDLLGVENGLIVLTKIDAIDDPDWVDLVEQDVMDSLQGTTLADAEFIRVSAYSGEGIPQLLDRLAKILNDLPPHIDYNHPRLPIDRVFTVSGFGTVVTGTLLGGSLHVGDEVEIQPSDLRGRVRGLQSYRQSVKAAYPGSRVAVNITGLEKNAVVRGDMLVYPGELHPTLLADVRFWHLPDAGRPLKHNAEVKLFSGTAESTARVRLLNDEIIAPDSEGWLQLRLSQKMPLAQGDRFIMRYPSPAQTIGGGVIVNPHPGRRWKRFRPEVIGDLETRLSGTPAQRVAQAADNPEPITRNLLQKNLGYSDKELDEAIQESLDQGLLLEFQDNNYLARSTWQQILNRMTDELSAFHRKAPLRLGMPREELRSRTGLKSTMFNALLTTIDQIVEDGSLIRLEKHEVAFNEQQQTRIRQLEQQFDADPHKPPSYNEAATIVSDPVLRGLIDLGEIVQVQSDVIFSRAAYDEMVTAVLQIIDQDGAITASTLRDRFDTSRKYAIGLLEHLDSIGITRRRGDERVRGRNT